MSTLWAFFWGALAALAIKPLYSLNMTSILMLISREYPNQFWQYSRSECVSGVALFVFLFLAFWLGGVAIGYAAGCVGVSHLVVIHVRFMALLRAAKERDC